MEGGNSSNNSNPFVPSKLYLSRLSKPTASSTNLGANVVASGSASGSPSPLPRTKPGRPPLHPSTPAKAAGKAAAQSQYRSEKHYHYMPINNVIRMMRRALPANAKISDEAKETVQECVSEFISFVTEEAREKCHSEKRIVITGDDLVSAMAELGFDCYVDPLQRYLQKYRQSEGRDQPLFPPVRLLRPTVVGPAVMLPLPMGPNNPVHHIIEASFGMGGGHAGGPSYTTTTPTNNIGGVDFGIGGSGVGADTIVIATPENIGGVGYGIGRSGVGANANTVVSTPENIGGASVEHHGVDASNNRGNDNVLGYGALFDVGSGSTSMDNVFEFEAMFMGGAQELEPFDPLA